MKKYIFIIAGFAALIFSTNVIAQHISPLSAETQRLMHDMRTDYNDIWTYSGSTSNTDQKSTSDLKVWVKPCGINNGEYFFGYSYYFNYTANGDSLAAELFNVKEFELATTSITQANANKYQYKIIVNDSVELVQWTTPKVFKSNKFISYAYLGKFDCQDKSIKLLIAEKNNKANYSVYYYNSRDRPAAKLRHLMIRYPTGLSSKNSSDWNKGFNILLAKLPESIDLQIESTPQNELYHVYLKREGDRSEVPVGNNWERSFSSPYPQMHIGAGHFFRPGKYTLTIRPEMLVGNGRTAIMGPAFKAYFIVIPGPATISLKLVIFIFLVVSATALRIYFYLRRKQRLAAQAKEIATLQLQSVRSQLNPHFIFNALAGIQNLMNKNEVENANKYLARFARLTRNVLDDGQKELTSIEHEVDILTDYLQMEQMRFGFKFNIEVDATIDQQIEIPTMLLQPFAENAVKHGISALKSDGIINVGIRQNNNDIILTVVDNGGGFNNTQQPGMGIKLCEERIKLLNSIYKNTSILLHINSTDKGATITIELKNWL